MQINPKGAPTLLNSKIGPSPSELRERAISAFNGKQNAEGAPVSNPNQVSPEELSAIIPKSTPASTQSAPSPAPQEGHSDSIETPSEPKAATTEAKDAEPTLSSQYAILARKEKALRAKVQQQDLALKSREAELAKREAEIKAKEAEYQSSYIPKNKLSEDPLTTMLEAGITYDQLTQMVLNQSSQAPVDPATKLAIQRLEEQMKLQVEAVEAAKKQQEESVKSQYQEALRQIRYDVNNLVKEDPSFELIKATGSAGDVVELIEKTYQEDGVILTVEEAAQHVENYLVDRVSKYAQTNKIQQKLKPKAEAPQAPKTEAQKPQATSPQQTQMKTLTNAVSSTRSLSAKERAVLAFQGKLK